MRLLLFSGGLDSTGIAAWQRPDRLLTVDYGQRAAEAELRAARRVAAELEMPWSPLRIDCSELGSGLLAAGPAVGPAPSPEWWPYRNQLLVTAAAAWGLRYGLTEVLIGCVAEDDGHADGRRAFIEALDRLLALQEGGVRLLAPAVDYSTSDLLVRSGLGPDVIGWTHSCDRGTLACGDCPSCRRRSAALDAWQRSAGTS